MQEQPSPALVIVPTYNEKENITRLVSEVLQIGTPVEVLVVDDSSPDGTAQLVREMQQTSSRVHLLVREKKEGLGKAYLAGFAWGLAKGYSVLVEMDADFSHRPVDLAKMLAEIPSCDFVVGSRYVEGGATLNWGLLRKVISRGGSLYARFVLGHPLRDWTGGFNAWKPKVLTGIGLDQVRSNGYSFQIELKYKALERGFLGKEVPILFEDRRVGKSKMSLRIVVEALWRVWMIR